MILLWAANNRAGRQIRIDIRRKRNKTRPIERKKNGTQSDYAMSKINDILDELVDEIAGGKRPRQIPSKEETIKETVQNLTPSLRLAAAKQLQQLSSNGQQRANQEQVIIAAAISRIFEGGYDRPEFWKRPDTCARSTFNKWKKHQPEFTAVFEGVCDLAKKWKSQQALDSLEEAMTILQLHTPESAWKMIQIMRTGDSEQVQQRMAAKDILQHASKETAEKGNEPAIKIDGIEGILTKIYGKDDPDA
jgi:hypothetical protein